MEIRSERVAQTIQMLQTGTPAHVIKETLGYANNNAVYNVAKRYGLELTDRYELERKEKSERINALYEQGYSTNEVVEQSGYTINQVFEYRDRKYSKNPAIFKTEEEVASLISTHGFEYISGYDGADSKVTVRCKTCGAVAERGMQSFNRKHAHTTCMSCYKASVEAKRIEREKEHKNELERKRVQRQIEKERRSTQCSFNIKTCPECEREFIAKSKGQTYCSTRCVNRKYNIKKSSEERLKGVTVIDKDITLKDLFIRDKGVCHICGRRCNWDDCYWENRVFFAGNDYPSIDHVVPISKGGEHSWENIKLAHRVCNSVKGNRT